MSMKINIRIEGISGVSGRFNRMKKETISELKKVMITAATMVQTRAKNKLTVKRHIVTGNLRRSISIRVVAKGQFNEEVIGYIGTDVVYARKIENLPDGGYLLQSLQELEPFINQTILTGFRRAVKNVGRM